MKEVEQAVSESKQLKRFGAGIMIGSFWVAILAPFSQGTISDQGVQAVQGICIIAVIVGLTMYGIGYFKGDH